MRSLHLCFPAATFAHGRTRNRLTIFMLKDIPESCRSNRFMPQSYVTSFLEASVFDDSSKYRIRHFQNVNVYNAFASVEEASRKRKIKAPGKDKGKKRKYSKGIKKFYVPFGPRKLGRYSERTWWLQLPQAHLYQGEKRIIARTACIIRNLKPPLPRRSPLWNGRTKWR